MREDSVTGSQTKNQMWKSSSKNNGNLPKSKSNYSWGSQIVKGFVTEKKAKSQASIPNNKKPPLASLEVSIPKNQHISYPSRVKRSLIDEFPCSPSSAQVHPRAYDSHRLRSPSSHNLFIELDHLRSLLQDSKDRERALHSELLHYKESPRVTELERELDVKRIEVESLNRRIGLLEVAKTNLSEQLASLSSILECQEGNSRIEGSQNLTCDPIERSVHKNLEVEIVELRRLNKELQFQKRNIAFRLSSTESQLAALAKVTESEILAKVQEEASVLRHTNEDLCKQVEGLQMSRLTEVEELAYLRWVNSCLRHELSTSDKLSGQSSDLDEDQNTIFKKSDSNLESDVYLVCPSITTTSEVCNAKKASSTKKLMNWSLVNEECRISECHSLFEANGGKSPQRRHSICGSKGCLEDFTLNKRRQSDGFITPKEIETETNQNKHQLIVQKYDLNVPRSPRLLATKPDSCNVERRAVRIPKPPPRPSISVCNEMKTNRPAPVLALPPPPPPALSSFVYNASKTNGSVPMLPPPPPPPPPPPKLLTKSSGVMQRAPQVAELYHSLMKRDSRKDSLGGAICDAPCAANVRSSMIGEIENRSSHLLAIKADVETQSEFVKSLIKEVNGAAYRDIEDVVAFVKWLDDELCFLVDERAVLKHFDWPEKKADTLREAAFGYRDLKKLESEVTNYQDDPRLPCDVALKKMVTLSEKMERSVYNLLRTRDVMMRHCKDCRVPTEWMLDTGIISKIKFASVKLAKKYMERVASELQARGAVDKDPALEYMLLQGVRFAFRIHQFAGGFDSETMYAFEELRNLAHFRKTL